MWQFRNKWILSGVQILALLAVVLDQHRSVSQDEPNRANPTRQDVAYGPHERNVLDFYQAKSDKPTPLVIFIHGGGFVGGNKNTVSPAM
ncbi:MAG: hypothetical protein ABL921_29830, partial [Pirellula sp.]